MAGVGDRITSVTNDVNSVKKTVDGVSQEVAGVGSKVENIQKEVSETAAEQKENFRKLNELQTKTLNEIFTRYQENKIKLELEFTHKGGFLGAEKKDRFVMDTIIMVDGAFAYSLVHAKESPFQIKSSAPFLNRSFGYYYQSKIKKPIIVKEVAFMDDPRILIIPLYINPTQLAKESEIEVFQAPKNPYLFAEAVVVDAKKGRFGQTDFIRMTETPDI